MNRKVSISVIFSLLVLVVLFVAGHFRPRDGKLNADILNATNIQNIASDNALSSSDGDPASTTTLSGVLQGLQDQISFLNSQVNDISSNLQVINLRTIFTRNLKLGDSGDDVRELQNLMEESVDTY